MSISARRRHDTSDRAAVSDADRLPSKLVRTKPRAASLRVLDEDLFSELLVRERKRSERSNRPFFLVSLAANGPLDLEASPAGAAILAAFEAATRGTDIVGWVKWPTVVGVICSELGAADPTQAIETVRTRLLKELSRRYVDSRTVEELSLEFCIYPKTAPGTSASESRPIDSVLHPDLYREERARRVSDWIKRAVDVVVSAALLVALAPLLAVAALMVRLTSPGPVLFKQRRLGKMGAPFRMLKFRTMYINAGENPHQQFVTGFIKQSGREQAAGQGQIFKLTNDPRITPVGRFLRKTSIDELPQLWNVLVGEMSLVGPRPPLPYEVEHYAPWHLRRVLEAKPGITGLWQVTGRSRTTFDEMVRLDLRYARTRSLWTDLRILLRTPGAVVGGKGAC